MEHNRTNDTEPRVNTVIRQRVLRCASLLLTLFLLGALSVQAASASWQYTTTTGITGTTYGWIDCESGSNIVSGNDSRASISWPFDFDFYDDSYTTSDVLSVCTNGFIRLDGLANTNANTARNFSLTSGSTTLGQIIALGIEDNNITTGGWVRSTVTGTAPFRVFTIEFNNMLIRRTDGRQADIQVQFHETSNKVIQLLGTHNVTRTGADMGLHSGVSGYFNKWQDVNNGIQNRWIEYSPPPVLVTATSGTGKARYNTLRDAFTAINNGVHRQTVTIQILGNTTETATAALNASGQGSANYTTVSLYPISNGVTVSGNINGPLISLNGADSVTIDGRRGATGETSELTFVNTNTAANAVTLLVNSGATNNVVRYCTLQGGGGGTGNGTAQFGTSGTNTGNTLEYNNITNNGTRRVNALYASGSNNVSNVVSNNNIFDNWSTTATSYAINLVNATGWTLQGNSIYETNPFNPGAANTYYGSYLSGAASQTNTLSDNFFGGKSNATGGAAMEIGKSSTQSIVLIPFYLNVTGEPTSVQGNYIRNIDYRSASTTPFYGFKIDGGSVNLGTISSNAIGDTTGTGSIILTATATSAVSYGVHMQTTGNVSIHNSRIGSLTLSNSSTANAHSFYGVYTTWVNMALSLKANTLGSMGTPASINATSAATGYNQFVTGLYTQSIGTVDMEDNTVANLRNQTTRNDAGAFVAGIRIHATSTTTLHRNLVYALSCYSTGSNSFAAGIYTTFTGAGSLLATNNLVSMGANTSNPLSAVYGVYNQSNAPEAWYHNTIILTPVRTGNTSAHTVAFNKGGWNSDVTLKNNLIINLGTGGTGGGRHVALSTGRVDNTTSDYNVLYAPGVNGAVGMIGGTAHTTMVNWQTASNRDINSSNENPMLVDPAGNYTQAYNLMLEVYGTDLRTLVPTDYYGTERKEEPTPGFFERPLIYAVEIFKDGSFQGQYTHLKKAFDKINDGTHTGDLILKVTTSIKERYQPVLNASGMGAANYTSVLLFPTKSGLELYGKFDGPLITLNGADNVIIDGRVNATGSTPDWIIYNSSTDANSVTLQLTGSASFNTFSYLNIRGGGGSATNGTITIGPGGSNNDNTITNSVITHNGSRRANAIYASGGTSHRNKLINSQIFDTWSTTQASSQVYIGAGSSEWTIRANSFYETSAFRPTAAVGYTHLIIENPSGQGFVLEDNYLGGSAPQNGGAALDIGSSGMAVRYIPLQLTTGSGIRTSIQGNKLSNIALASSNTQPFTGILLQSGAYWVGQQSSNTIGETSGTGSIQLLAGANATSYAVYVESTDSVTLASNRIGSITLTTTNQAHSFTGIHKSATAGYMEVLDNTIGSLQTAGSINTTNTNGGIQQNLIGIDVNGSGMSLLRGNTVSGLTNTAAQMYSYVYGISLRGTGNPHVAANFVYNLTLSTASMTNNLAGIYSNKGSNTMMNNIVVLSAGGSTSRFFVNGIRSEGTAVDAIYHNTVLLKGTVSGTSSAFTSAYLKYENATVTVRNNLFYNALSGGSGTGRHSAIGVNTTTGFTSNNNLLYAPNTNGVIGAAIAGAYSATAYATMANWRSYSGQDAASLSSNPSFYNINGTTPLDYGTSIPLGGADLRPQVPTDFADANRSANPTMGAWEYFAPVDVYEGATLLGSYSTLKATFDAINSGAHAGNLRVHLNRNTTETATAQLNASGAGSANYQRVLIFPYFKGITVSGSLNAPLIALNGADNIVIDGRMRGTGTESALALINNSTGTSAVTLLLNNGATRDTIRYTHIQGGSGSSTNGTIHFGNTGTNSDNMLEWNVITNNGTRRVNAVYASGGTFTNNTLRYNTLFDTWLPSATSYSINIGTGASGWSLIGNSLYETTSLQPTGNYTYYGIRVNSAGTGFQLIGNRVGGRDSLNNGDAMSLGVTGTLRSLVFYPIHIQVGNASSSLLSNNLVRNIALRSSSNAPFSGLWFDNGSVNVVDNVVGDTLGTGSITLTGTDLNPSSYGIYLGGATFGTVSGNRIGSITTANTTTANAHNLYGIYVNTSGTLTLSGNGIGSENTANSLWASATATGQSQHVFGIYTTGTGTYHIDGNHLANLTNATTETNQASKLYGIYVTNGITRITNNVVHDLTSWGSANGSNYANTSMTGITSVNSAATQYIVGNTVYNLTSFTTAQVEFYGIFLNPSLSGNDTVANNFIHGFRMYSESTTCYLHGLSMYSPSLTNGGVLTVYNNIVFVGDSITRGSNLFGVLKNTNKRFHLYHNTIHLGGTVSDGSSTTSFALRDRTEGTPELRDIRNNIFYNTRSGGGSNYSLYIHLATDLSIDYNDYGWSGTYFASINSGNLVTLQEWLQLMAGQDEHSRTVDPQFVNMGGTQATDYQTYIGLDGVPGTGVSTDFGGGTRSTGSPSMGAWENVPVDIYTGGQLRASYFNLKAAFDAINAGHWTGNLTIKLKGSTQETATAQLNASGTGAASYSGVLIHPVRNQVVVRGDINGDLIRFNGADHVIVDGRLNADGSTIDLNITNINTGASATTIRFAESASDNTVRYTQLSGAGSDVMSAIVSVSTASIGDGNDRNTFTNNHFTGLNATNRPRFALLSEGSSGRTNSGNAISNNRFYDTWRPNSDASMVQIGSGSDDWTITGNSFYETTSFVPTGAFTYSAIHLDDLNGGGHVVTNNYVGGTLEQALGSPMTLGASGQAATFVPFRFRVGNAVVSSIQGNIITNMQVTSNASQPFAAIYVDGGTLNIGTTTGNRIGAVAGNDNIIVNSAATDATSVGLYLSGSGEITVANNTLGAMTLNATAGNAHNFVGLLGSGTGRIHVTKNDIGSTTTINSVRTAGAPTTRAQSLEGIRYEGTGTFIVTGNRLSNLYNAAGSNQAGTLVAGIRQSGTGTALIEANFVNDLSMVNNGANSGLYGIWMADGSNTSVNNVIHLGGNNTGYNKIYGLYEEGNAGKTDSIMHNTVYLSGTVGGTATTALTSAFYKQDDQGNTVLLNNILVNARSGGATASSRHWAVSIPGTNSIARMDGNLYRTTGTGGMLGRLATNDINTLTLWKQNTGHDANSLSQDPDLLNAGGQSPLDYKPRGVLNGVASGWIIDFGDENRDVFAPTIGAWEFFLCVEIWSNGVKLDEYATLKEAFDDINAAVWTGNLTVKVLKNTYETATATLLASGSGPNYSRIHLYPTREDVTVSGSLNAPLVDVQGANQLTIDGRVNAVGAPFGLTFRNENTGSQAVTIRFAQSARYDTLQYSHLMGAGQGSTAGVIHVGTSSSGSGNAYLMIRGNRISGLNEAERPVNALYSQGTSGRLNSDIRVQDNTFYDVLVPGTTSNAIHIGSWSTAFSLVGNSFFNRSVLSVPTASELTLIRIDNASGGGFLLENNYLGGDALLAAGTWVKMGQNTPFTGIYLNVGNASASGLQGNTIRGFSFTNQDAADFTAIHIQGGTVNVGTEAGNLIGSPSGQGNITLTNGASDGAFYGIRMLGSDPVTVNETVIGSITTANTNQAHATHIYGVYKGAVGGSLTLTDNVIGSTTTASSLMATSNAYQANQLVYGVYGLGTGNNLIQGNTVANMLNNTIETTRASKMMGIYLGSGTNTVLNNTLSHLTSGGSASGSTGVDASVIGLLLNVSTSGQQVTGNTIAKLKNLSTAKVSVYAMYINVSAAGNNTLYGNFINQVVLPVAPPESEVVGLYVQNGSATMTNNIIAMGDSLSKGVNLYGFRNASSSSLTIYHNTIYLGGAVTAGASTSVVIHNDATGGHNLRNNVFANLRTGGGKNYAIVLSGTSGMTINYNTYWADGTNGILGYLVSDRTSLAAWKSATGQDVNSLFQHPLFFQSGTDDPLNYTPMASMIAYNGLVPTDYKGTSRSVPPTMGALELSGYFWMGTLDTDWSKSDNWLPKIVPTLGLSVNIPSRSNNPVIYSGVAAEANSLNIYSGAVVTINPGGSLTVASTITNNAGAAGLVIHSTEDGTGSLISSQDGVQATVRRYIRRQSARNTAWFTLSSPITEQNIRGTEWTPFGSFGDGTGYDLFVWDEPTASWVYNLNDTTTIDKNWTVAHPQAYFVPGRGYLYSLYDSISTKSFVGTLNNGTIQAPLTVSGSGSNKGFRLVGNPYPSSMDWKAASGYDRSNLTLSGGGYDLWMWSSTANNYGLYNSALTGDNGTLNASRYIAPMQGFFVLASSAGNMEFNNNARVHESAGAWLRSAGTSNGGGTIRLKVVATSGSGSDEVMLRFGTLSNDKGSPKLFSPVTTAPSLYLPLNGKSFSLRSMTSVDDNTHTYVNFKPGMADAYTITCDFDELMTETVILEDRRRGILHNFAESGEYSFTAEPNDADDRFVLHYGSVSLNPDLAKYRVYVAGSNLVVNLEDVGGEYTVSVFDLNGRIQQKQRLFGGSAHLLPLSNRGVYVVSINTESGTYNHKIVY